MSAIAAAPARRNGGAGDRVPRQKTAKEMRSFGAWKRGMETNMSTSGRTR
jgi:hypothetical protein